MTNPRATNLLQQGPNAAPPATLPPIPTARSGMPDVDAAILAIKQNLDIRNGTTGNPWEKWVARRDLANLGLLGSSPLSALPVDALGVPVWTSRNTFVLVPASLFGAAGSSGSTDLTSVNNSIADLSRRLSDLTSSVDPVVIQQTIQAAIASAASAVAAHVFSQAVASTSWTLTHNLGRAPILSVYDTTGTKIEPHITNPDQNTTTIAHGRATAGTVVYQ